MVDADAREMRDGEERWHGDVTLADGSTMRVRPIEAEDVDLVRAFHERQSRESIYYRFFSPRPRLSDSELLHLTTVDGVDRMAFVAVRDDSLAGVARYDRYGSRPVAEVAFFTDDEMGGKGIATVLLEYLAAHGRTMGISRFMAQVLTDNRRMVRVFRQAGYEVSSEFADGVIEVTLDIEPTEQALAAMADRADAAERQSVVRLLEPSTIAVIGAGRDEAGLGHRLLRNLVAAPFQGIIHPIHPEAASIAGIRAHATIGDVPDQIDLAVVCVPAEAVASVIEACGRARVGAAVVISAGFAEAGAAGRESQADIVAVARRYGLRLLGPNCLGVVNTDPAVRLHATFADIDPPAGGVALLSQSGTLGAVVLEQARRTGVGVSSFVSVGNKADLSGNDLLQYWLDDERTEVVLLHLESFGNPRRFGRNVRRVAARKPVFAVRTGIVAASAASGGEPIDDATVDALLRQTGVVRVPTVRALLDAARVAVAGPIPTGRGVAVVGNSGGSVSMAADACVAAGLELAELSPSTRTAVDAIRLQGRSASNPVELGYDAGHEEIERAVAAVMADPLVSSVLVVHAPASREVPDPILAVLDRVQASAPTVTMVGCVYGERASSTPGGLPLFEFPDEAAHALGRVVRYGVWREAERAGDVLACDDAPALRAWVRARLRTAGGDVVLGAVEARELLHRGGVETVPVDVLHGPDEVADPALVDRGPVAVKALHHATGATTRAAGVALDVVGIDGVASAVEDIAAGLGSDAFPIVVQPMVRPGADVRIDLRPHPVVGWVLELGPGGAAGRYAPMARRVLPVTDVAADLLITEAGLDEALSTEGRGRLIDVLRRLDAMVEAAPEIAAVRADPVIVRDDAADLVEVTVALAMVDADEPAVRRV